MYQQMFEVKIKKKISVNDNKYIYINIDKINL